MIEKENGKEEGMINKTEVSGSTVKRTPTGAEINTKLPAVLRFGGGHNSTMCISMTKAYETFPDDWDTFWEAIENTLQKAKEETDLLFWIPSVKSFVVSIRRHFEANGVYNMISSGERIVILNIMKRQRNDMVTYDMPMSEVTRIMMPSSEWNLHIAPTTPVEG